MFTAYQEKGSFAVRIELMLMRAIALMPMAGLRALSTLVGAFYWRLSGSARAIILDNLSICFPVLSARERARIARESCRGMVLGYLEMAKCWFGDIDRTEATIDGLEHLHEARALGKGVLLLGFHFTDAELSLSLLSRRVPITAMFLRFVDPVFDEASRKGRGRRAKLIERGSMRDVVAALKQGETIWFAPDQEYGDRRMVPAPFFGTMVPSLTSTSRLARAAGAAVIPFLHHRVDQGVRITLLPPVPEFGSDGLADATRVNAVLESAIRARPGSYLWINRRLRRHVIEATDP